MEEALRKAFRRHQYVENIISDNQCVLKRVVVSDSRNWGKVCMGEEVIVECRRSLALDNDEDSTLEYNGMVWYVPDVDFPVHGYTMKRAILFFIFPTSLPEDFGYENLLKDFEDDEEEEWKIFNEAVREIVTVNKNNKYKTGLHLQGTSRGRAKNFCLGAQLWHYYIFQNNPPPLNTHTHTHTHTYIYNTRFFIIYTHFFI